MMFVPTMGSCHECGKLVIFSMPGRVRTANWCVSCDVLTCINCYPDHNLCIHPKTNLDKVEGIEASYNHD